LLLLSIIVIVTLYTVQRDTYKHSTTQLLGQMQTSASVVKDKINNRVSTLSSGLQNLTKDFSIKQLLANANKDKLSLVSAMGDFQSRLGADIYWVLDLDAKLLASSANDVLSQSMPASLYAQPGIHWYQ
jgi:hypothetical protein